MRSAALATLVLLCLSGCVAEGRSEAAKASPVPSVTAKPTPTVTPTPTSTRTPGVWSVEDATAVKDASGIAMSGALEAYRDAGTKATVLAIASDGAAAVAVSQKIGEDSVAKVPQSRLELRTADGKSTPIPGVDDVKLPRQAIYAAADPDTVVWMESSSPDSSVTPWTLLAFDRKAGTTKILAQSTDVAATSVGRRVFLMGGRVYWTADKIVYSCAVGGGAVTRELEDATNLTVTQKALFYMRQSAGREAVVRRHDLGTDKETVIATASLGDTGQFAGLAADGDDVAWIVNHIDDVIPGEISDLTLRTSDGKTVKISGRNLSEPVMTPGMLAFDGLGGQNRTWVYDRTRAGLVELDPSDGGVNVYASANRLVWRGNATWRFLTLS